MEEGVQTRPVNSKEGENGTKDTCRGRENMKKKKQEQNITRASERARESKRRGSEQVREGYTQASSGQDKVMGSITHGGEFKPLHGGRRGVTK